MDILIKPRRDVGKHARLRHHTHGQHDTHHKQNLLNIAILDGTGRQPMRRHLVGGHQFTVEQFVNHPQHGEHTERTEEGRQLRDIMECRDEPQPTDTYEEHHHPLPGTQVRVIPAIGHRRPLVVKTVRKHPVDEDCGNHPSQNGGQRHI